MKIRKRRLFCYVVAALLVVFYLVVLAKSMDYSRTSESYRAFYITRTLPRYYTEEEYQQFKEYFRPYTTLYLRAGENTDNLGEGWSDREETATWAIGETSTFYLYMDHVDTDHAEGYQLVIETEGSAGYDNDLYVNGMNQGSIRISDNKAVIPVSAAALQPGLNTFTIQAEEKVLPFYELHTESEDTRALNLYVHSITLLQVQAADDAADDGMEDAA